MWNRKKEKRLTRNEDSLRELWTMLNALTSVLWGAKRRRERERDRKMFEEITAKNFPNMGKESLTQIQKTQPVPYKINPKRNTLRHILIKRTKIKDKEKILKGARE